MSHTPGPWSLCAHLANPETDEKCGCHYRGGVWSGDGEALVCEMGGTRDVNGYSFLPEVGNRVEMVANARLIAAAPELLEALKMALDQYTNKDWPAAVALRDVIAKAEGR